MPTNRLVVSRQPLKLEMRIPEVKSDFSILFLSEKVVPVGLLRPRADLDLAKHVFGGR